MTTTRVVKDTETLRILTDNISALPHPNGIIRHPYFDTRFTSNRKAVQDMTRIFCEAIVLLLEKHDRLRKPPGRPRKTDDA